MFVLTENMVFGACFYNVSPASIDMQITTLSLNEAEMKGELIIHVIHVAGTRMKELEIEGLS